MEKQRTDMQAITYTTEDPTEADPDEEEDLSLAIQNSYSTDIPGIDTSSNNNALPQNTAATRTTTSVTVAQVSTRHGNM